MHVHPFASVHNLPQFLGAHQRQAISVALVQPFTVINGVAGSGKTMVAIQLVLLFTHVRVHLHFYYSTPAILLLFTQVLV